MEKDQLLRMFQQAAANNGLDFDDVLPCAGYSRTGGSTGLESEDDIEMLEAEAEQRALEIEELQKPSEGRPRL